MVLDLHFWVWHQVFFFEYFMVRLRLEIKVRPRTFQRTSIIDIWDGNRIAPWSKDEAALIILKVSSGCSISSSDTWHRKSLRIESRCALIVVFNISEFYGWNTTPDFGYSINEPTIFHFLLFVSLLCLFIHWNNSIIFEYFFNIVVFVD